MVIFALNTGVNWWPEETGPEYDFSVSYPGGTNIMAHLQTIWKALNVFKNSEDDNCDPIY